MLGLIDVRLERITEAEERLRPWVMKHKDFNHAFFLAHFYYSAGLKKECIAALREANQWPINTLWVRWRETKEMQGSLTGESCAWYAAMLAYREDELDLCLAICDKWEKYIRTEKKYGDPAYGVFRAACYLRQGKFEEAKEQMKATVNGPNYVTTRGEHADELFKAVERRDRAFRYRPNKGKDNAGPELWNILVDYR